MYDGDDVDLLYVLSPYGWSTCILSVDQYIYELKSKLAISRLWFTIK
jgi:hypothetical protein